MTQAQQIAEAVKQVLAANGAVAAQPKRTKAEMLSDKDRALKGTFTKRGYKDVVLAPRDAEGKIDLTAEFNVRPYKAWPQFGRQVRKSEKGVRGLFHVSQTDAVAAQ